MVNAFVSGFGYNADCAVASTVAHDSHHMIVVGTNKADMALAANRLQEVGGGIVVVQRRPGAGAGRAADRRPDVGRARRDRGGEGRTAWSRRCAPAAARSNNAFMQHSLLALVVIPELRISDVGLIDVTRFAKTELFVT